MEMIVRQKSTLNERPPGIIFLTKNKDFFCGKWSSTGHLAVLQEEFLRWERSWYRIYT